MNSKEALEHIKNAPTIYCGCGSDVYARYPIEVKVIEKDIETLFQICKSYDEYINHNINANTLADEVGLILTGRFRR